MQKSAKNPSVAETERVSGYADWYLNQQLDIDKQLIQFRYESQKPHLLGPKGLELGPAEGEMTKYLLQDFNELTIVDGAAELLAHIPDAPNLKKVHSLFEDFKPPELFNTVIMEHILEHVDNPSHILGLAKKWLAPGGRLLVGVPNGNSFHRLLGVQMGLLKNQCDLNERDHAVGHRRVYTQASLRKEIEGAGYEVIHMGGIFFKTLSNKQMQEQFSPELLRGFFELGKMFQENSSDIYAICQYPAKGS
jgi:2-polyprenyl-3-methyl-5-hydroxy-6-metoxy-1,4-benzoquinol methylase